ncbi:MAG: ATP-binding protein [Chloroflexota bacterium]|nr:ATP-binding protein [Chloroflexota bacterium]
MTHPLFGTEFFVETPFAKRFQATLRSSLHKRSWHVIVADPGSGKTMSIRDLVETTGAPAILAVTCPKNNDDEQALGDQLFTALGVKLPGHWRTRKPKLMGHLPKCTFSGEVPIDLQHFLESGVSLVECPDCTSTSALSPHKGILHFKPHKRRKTRSTSTEPRWTRHEMIWAVVNK